jgi:predicted Zn-dependent protease with MMP-like domain
MAYRKLTSVIVLINSFQPSDVIVGMGYEMYINFVGIHGMTGLE